MLPEYYVFVSALLFKCQEEKIICVVRFAGAYRSLIPNISYHA